MSPVRRPSEQAFAIRAVTSGRSRTNPGAWVQHSFETAHDGLVVRQGAPTALGFYADNERIHVGDVGSVADQAYTAWAADRAQGLDSILLAPTRDLVTQLNDRARNSGLTSP